MIPTFGRRGVGLVSLLLLGAVSVVGCSSERQLAGAQIEPPPDVSSVELPELTNGGQAGHLVPVDSDLLLVYFGYTSCPDYCPRTMADLASAVQRLDDPSRVNAAMVTIDPDRDLDNLSQYVRSFFEDGRAFGTDDQASLAAAANAFGVTYSVTPDPDATDPATASPIVSHSTSAYAVNQDGAIVLTWPYGTSISDIELDLEQLLADAR